MKKNIMGTCFFYSIIILCACSFKKNSKTRIVYVNPEIGIHQTAITKKIISRYEKINKNAFIDFQSGGNPDKILSMIASGTQLDVFYGYLSIYDYIARNSIIDLAPLIKKNEINFNDYYRIGIASCTYKNSIYGMPIQLSGYNIAYNKTLLLENNLPLPPREWTLEEFIGYLKKLNSLNPCKEGKEKIFILPSIVFGHFFEALGMYDAENGCIDIRKKDDLLRLCRTLQELNTQIPSSAEIGETYQAAGSPGAVFSMKKCYLYYTPTWVLGEFMNIRDFDWDIVKPPYFNGYKKHVIGLSYLSIPAISRQRDSAFDFIKYYISKTASDLFASRRNGMCARIDSTRKFFIPPPANIASCLETLEESVPKYQPVKGQREHFIKFGPYMDHFRKGGISIEKLYEEIIRTAGDSIEKIRAE